MKVNAVFEIVMHFDYAYMPRRNVHKTYSNIAKKSFFDININEKACRDRGNK